MLRSKSNTSRTLGDVCPEDGTAAGLPSPGMDCGGKTVPGLAPDAGDETVPDWTGSWPGEAIVPGLREIPGVPSSAPAFDIGHGCEAAAQPASCWPASEANEAAAGTGPSVPGIETEDGQGLVWSLRTSWDGLGPSTS